MASTTFVDFSQNTPIVASWLNDVNKTVYDVGGNPTANVTLPFAWVRFSVSGGVATVQTSSNIASVSRSSAGVFVVTYGRFLAQAQGCYQISTNQAGFTFVSAEATNSVTVNTNNTSNVATDPGFVSVVVFVGH